MVVAEVIFVGQGTADHEDGHDHEYDNVYDYSALGRHRWTPSRAKVTSIS